MRLLCIFRPHKWKHIFNTRQGNYTHLHWVGIYQCSRCKEISQGMARDMDLNRLRCTKDGNAYCIHLDDFVDLMVSPALFLGEDTWQGRALWEARDTSNLLEHLPAGELVRLYEELTRE